MTTRDRLYRNGFTESLCLESTHGNSGLTNSNPPGAVSVGRGFNIIMYCTDAITGETLFEFAAPVSARKVLLEGCRGAENVRVPMRRVRSRWKARLAIAPGWFFYRYKVDGHLRLDAGAGRLRTGDGQRYNLAVIQSCLPSHSRKPARPAEQLKTSHETSAGVDFPRTADIGLCTPAETVPQTDRASRD